MTIFYSGLPKATTSLISGGNVLELAEFVKLELHTFPNDFVQFGIFIEIGPNFVQVSIL